VTDENSKVTLLAPDSRPDHADRIGPPIRRLGAGACALPAREWIRASSRFSRRRPRRAAKRRQPARGALRKVFVYTGLSWFHELPPRARAYRLFANWFSLGKYPAPDDNHRAAGAAHLARFTVSSSSFRHLGGC